MDDKNKECCPKFDPSPWDKKTVVWKEKLFLKDSIPQFFHIPFFPMVGKKITEMWDKAKKAKADPEMKDFLMLFYDLSPWKSEFYLSLTKDIPNENVVKLSGTFLTMVFDGPYNAVPKWIKEIEKYAKEKNKVIKKHYFYYTTCPKCAKKYGHNYVVSFTEVE